MVSSSVIYGARSFSAFASTLCFLCFCPTLILLALTIYYGVGNSSLTPTTCTITGQHTSTYKVCNVNGCSFYTQFYYDVKFPYNDKTFNSQTEMTSNTFPVSSQVGCWFNKNNTSFVLFQNYFYVPFVVCISLL